MAEKRDSRIMELKRESKGLIKDLRRVQLDLAELRAIGADETSIRQVMVLMGFGSVTPDDFLSASTAEGLGRLVSKVSGARLN